LFYFVFRLSGEQEGYNELFSDGYNPSHADLDLRLTDDEDEADEADSKRRHSSSAGTKSRLVALYISKKCFGELIS